MIPLITDSCSEGDSSFIKVLVLKHSQLSNDTLELTTLDESCTPLLYSYV